MFFNVVMKRVPRLRGRLTGNTEQHEIPPTRIIQDLQLLKVLDHDSIQYVRDIALVVRIPNVVDAHPHAKEGVFGRPRRHRRRRHRGIITTTTTDALTKLGDLVDEAEHGGLEGGDEARVGGGAAVGKVVREEQRLVVRGHQDADPVGAPAGGVPREGWVAEGVGGAGEGAVDVEVGGGVRIAAGASLLTFEWFWEGVGREWFFLFFFFVFFGAQVICAGG